MTLLMTKERKRSRPSEIRTRIVRPLSRDTCSVLFCFNRVRECGFLGFCIYTNDFLQFSVRADDELRGLNRLFTDPRRLLMALLRFKQSSVLNF
jgi:hypothetical protein